jgi:hypothetical protein
MANNHPYVTYFNSPIQIGTGIDNINTTDAGDVVLTQTVQFAGNGTQTIQLPAGAKVILLSADNVSGAAVTAGTINVQDPPGTGLIGATGATAGAISLSTTVSRTALTTTYAGAAFLNSVPVNNNLLTIITAGVLPAGAAVLFTVTYKMNVTP